ncbi:MAG TPA: CmcJ/NvfI family oxidoreductase [Allosphingosinicella sp.]
MNAQSRILPAAVEASLDFLRPMKERPVSYQVEPPPGVPERTGIYDSHAVTIHNGRFLAAGLSLDVQGFAMVRSPTGLTDFSDKEAIGSAYYKEVETLLAGITGAARVIVFDHNVRNAARAASGEAGIRGPVPRTHNDFTQRSGPERARRELELRGLDADALLGRRFAIVNLWRPIGRPVERSPLALADARTVAPADVIAADLIYRDRIGETYALQHNPAQLWYYFPYLAPVEAILIKSWDSYPQAARFAPHAAFEDPTTRPDAPERESIEVRALVLY